MNGEARGAVRSVETGTAARTMGADAPDEPTASGPSASEPFDGGRWSVPDLLWLLDGDWTVSSGAGEVVASRAEVAVVLRRERGVYRATTRLRGVEYNYHQSATLPGVLAGVRRDLRREGV